MFKAPSSTPQGWHRWSVVRTNTTNEDGEELWCWQISSITENEAKAEISGRGSHHQNYKTELCLPFYNKDCMFDEECHYAHGLIELRPKIRNANYKRAWCKEYVKTKRCRFGSRCIFRHFQHDVCASAAEPDVFTEKEYVRRVMMEAALALPASAATNLSSVPSGGPLDTDEAARSNMSPRSTQGGSATSSSPPAQPPPSCIRRALYTLTSGAAGFTPRAAQDPPAHLQGGQGQVPQQVPPQSLLPQSQQQPIDVSQLPMQAQISAQPFVPRHQAAAYDMQQHQHMHQHMHQQHQQHQQLVDNSQPHMHADTAPTPAPSPIGKRYSNQPAVGPLGIPSSPVHTYSLPTTGTTLGASPLLTSSGAARRPLQELPVPSTNHHLPALAPTSSQGSSGLLDPPASAQDVAAAAAATGAVASVAESQGGLQPPAEQQFLDQVQQQIQSLQIGQEDVPPYMPFLPSQQLSSLHLEPLPSASSLLDSPGLNSRSQFPSDAAAAAAAGGPRPDKSAPEWSGFKEWMQAQRQTQGADDSAAVGNPWSRPGDQKDPTGAAPAPATATAATTAAAAEASD